jgi:hypothetical protein
VWCMLSIDEEYCGIRFGGNVDSSCESHLRGLHCIHHTLDGRDTLDFNDSSLVHYCGRAGGSISLEVSMGLLVVVLCLCPGRSTRLLLVFLLAYGRLQLGYNTSSEECCESEGRKSEECSNCRYRRIIINLIDECQHEICLPLDNK